jgi:hypothetical protein
VERPLSTVLGKLLHRQQLMCHDIAMPELAALWSHTSGNTSGKVPLIDGQAPILIDCCAFRNKLAVPDSLLLRKYFHHHVRFSKILPGFCN